MIRNIIQPPQQVTVEQAMNGLLRFMNEQMLRNQGFERRFMVVAKELLYSHIRDKQASKLTCVSGIK